jgi:hypothetical protein
MLQEKCIVYEAIKIYCFERWLDFRRWRRGASGASPSFDACTSWIFLGCVGIPKLELLSILHLISSFSNPYTWKLPSYKTQHNSISNVSISIIIDQPFLVQISTQKHHI